MNYLIYLLIGLFSGFMSGMFGIGGGSIRTPLLYFAGVPLISSFGINLFVIPFSSFTGALTHRKNIKWDIAKYVVFGGLLGTVLGAFLTGYLSKESLAIIFFIVSVLTVTGIYFENLFPSFYKRFNPSSKVYFLGAFILNFITIMRGGSGGSLFPPFLKMMKLDIREAIATSLFTTFFTSLGGILIFGLRGDILFYPALFVVAGSIAGSWLGSLMSLKTKPKWLKLGLSILVIVLSLLVLVKTFIK